VTGQPPGSHPGEAGSVTIEAVIGVPAFVLFVVLIIVAGRVEIARQAVSAAAYDAARAASISRSKSEAIEAGRAAGTASLHEQGLRCPSPHVTVNAPAFDAPLGAMSQVTATVRCEVNLSDLTLPGIPGSRTITATAGSPVDPYREHR
jgi:Flp pilus assembly protein TadG